MDDEFRLRRRIRAASPRALGTAGLCSVASAVLLATSVLLPVDQANGDTFRPPVDTAPANLDAGVTVLITPAKVYVGREVIPIRDPNLRGRVRAALEGAAEHPWDQSRTWMVLVVDNDAPYAVMSDVVNVANQAGRTQVRLITRNVR